MSAFVRYLTWDATLGVPQSPQSPVFDQLFDDVYGSTVPCGLVQNGEPARAARPPLVRGECFLLVLKKHQDFGPVAGFRIIGEAVGSRPCPGNQKKRI